MLGRSGPILSRFVGLVFLVLGFWVFAANLAERGYEGWVSVWVLLSGLLGSVGGLLYLLSYDGPGSFRTSGKRRAGWAAMMVLALLPSSVSPILLVLGLLIVPTLSRREARTGTGPVPGG